MSDEIKTTLKSEPPLDFEQSLRQLEDIVRKMEQGELSLESSLGAFEEGVKLTRNCQAALQRAEQKVKILIENSDGEFSLADFNSTND
ncbi:exodeoxyribonuclease VII small subunit [Alkalimarinus alittae]|uniref:Exodeoxyribonuclease 7 small subunit n=1 Tax=Alkalimarinus alittae TaxID=2961619 RepID=A0ABY6N0D8_9ALTE|nr:exodeoxyribonuclease VII small subunit [Alkalimarinus alittae]UZE95544.1 exodeoxyribonuclease VII small subunit [Alkalimarinus alittae]